MYSSYFAWSKENFGSRPQGFTPHSKACHRTRSSALYAHLKFSQLISLRSIWMLSYPLFLWLTCARTNTVRILDRHLPQTLALFPSFAFLTYISTSINIDLNFSNLFSKKKKQSLYRSGQALRLFGVWGTQVSKQSADEDGKVVSPSHWPLLPPGNIPGG